MRRKGHKRKVEGFQTVHGWRSRVGIVLIVAGVLLAFGSMAFAERRPIPFLLAGSLLLVVGIGLKILSLRD